MTRASKTNRVGLVVLSSILVIAGTSGFLVPVANFTSNASLYNIFHIVSGFIGFAILMYACDRSVKIFNLVFGIVDLYQFAAGQLDFFPNKIFSLQPADDWIHLAFGITLIAIGSWGLSKEPKIPSNKATSI